MPNYDFHNCLSPREFEELVQDILEIKENVNFEISGRGRDGGVDLRHWHENTKIIVQVKCFQNSFNQLRYVLKNQELPKARALHPTRYILVTSLKIELEQRNEIYNLFDGIIKSRDDIIDRDDLNKLLRNNKYSNVERAHYKLWMSSTEVLSTILDDVVHRGILTESKFELMEIKEAIKTYVQNPSFGRALDIIDRNKYVLISGEPGVGKTTLARCLAAYYLERMDYKEFIYVDSVGSAFSMYKESEKQIFFFDDFWGDVFKETKHTNNEEKHLLKLIQHISKSKNKILILSTREYVLQQGLGQYYNEQLTNTLNDGKCFLELKDYSDLIKAKILFNHLYFSDLEWDYVKIIAERYELLTHHHNYNPRIIDTFLKLKSIFNENDPEKYYQGFIDYLNDPIQFWKEIFMKQTFEAKLICLILLVSSQPLRLNELKDSYHSCLEIARLNNISLQECEFADIIPQLEKTIILTYKAERIPSIIVKFQNSSIKEYLYQFLTDNLHFYGNILIRGCNYINQLLSMFRTSNKNFYIYEGGIEDALEREKILLPGNLKKQLICRIVNDFDILKYSYPEGDVYEHTPSIYTAKEDCVVRKLQDVFNSFGVNDDSEADGFLIGKMRDLCAKLHNEDYSFSYDDMVMFPYLVKDLIPLIDFDGAKLIQDYYEHSRFSEHLLVLNEFQNNFPGEFAHFKKMNHKMIKKKIRELLIDDVDFFAGDGEYDYVNFLIDVVYPEILETYKIRESKLFYKRLLRTADYDDPNDENEQGQVQLKDNPMIIELEVKDKRMEELIRREQEMLLGKSTEEIPDKDIITFITENSRSHLEAADLIKLYKCQRPWYIWPFFDNWDRLTLLLTYYEEYKSFPSSSAQFYQQLVCFLLRKNETTMSKNGISALTKMFSEFAYDMMKKNQNIFSIQTICDYPLFKDYLGTEDIQLTDLVSFPFIIQRGKWYTFQTIAFQSYLSIKKFLSFDQETIKKSYCDFLDLRGCFADNEHNIWLLCSELDLSAFNHYYVYPSLNEYLKAVNSTNNRTICSTTLQFLGYSVFFKISRSTPYPILVNGSSFNSIIPVSLLEFISKDLFDLDSYLSETIDSSDPIMFQRLSDFIIQNGSKGSSKNEYELNLAECSTDQGLLNIFDALGVCKTLSKLYYDVIRLVQKTTVANYNIRLDRYLSDSKIRIFASTT